MGSGLSQEEPVEEEIVSEAHAALYMYLYHILSLMSLKRLMYCLQVLSNVPRQGFQVESQSLLPRSLPQDDEGSGGSVAPEEDEATASKASGPSCLPLLCVTV